MVIEDILERSRGMKMKKSMLMKLGCFILAAEMIISPLSVYAEPIVVSDSNEGIIDPSAIDDDEVLEAVNINQKNYELVSPEKMSEYLLANAKEELVKQVPTDVTDESLPEKFDLRERGVVTPVKSQSPWGTCWGFSAIAACETSILSEMGTTYDETGLDLSEHHLTYFSRTYLKDGSNQDGEGVHMFDESQSLDTGGFAFIASSLFSSGIGPVDESLVPYRGINSKAVHSGFRNSYYSPKDDWSIPEDYEFIQQYDLVESNILPSPAVYDFGDNLSDGDMEDREKAYVGYDASATDNIKRELMAGRGVSVCYSADTYSPGQLSSLTNPLYLNTNDNKWTHYTFDGADANHAVTIVGWDDSIKSTEFLDHSIEKYSDGLAHQPEGDGAWIVKNSWGYSKAEFPNRYEWGICDENGDSTGYFYLSYYDKSIIYPETFIFDVTERSNNAFMIDMYDYMPASGTEGWADEDGLQMANIFTAEADGVITGVSCQTNTENVSTIYQIYLLDDDAITPDDGELKAVETADYDYAGYHRKVLETPVSVKKGQRYSVVISSSFTDGEKVYYEFSTSTGDNKASVEEYNRKVLYSHRSDPHIPGQDPEKMYAGELHPYYYVGIVNEGESFVYADELGQWADLALLVPYLQKADKYAGIDFDNFPVKAYLEYADGAEADDSAKDIMTGDYNPADPAGKISYKFIIEMIVLLIILVFVIRHIVRSIKKKRHYKKMIKQIDALEKENEELKAKLDKATENNTTEKKDDIES